LIHRLEGLLCADVRRIVVTRLDLVRDTTTVDVRYRILGPPTSPAHVSPSPTVEIDVAEGKGTTP
jgi:hypothetical protein